MGRRKGTGREKDGVDGGMTNGNEEPRIYIGIGEPTHNASTSDHTTKGGEKSLPRPLLTTRQRGAHSNIE
jgi:hypothetical protein